MRELWGGYPHAGGSKCFGPKIAVKELRGFVSIAFETLHITTTGPIPGCSTAFFVQEGESKEEEGEGVETCRGARRGILLGNLQAPTARGGSKKGAGLCLNRIGAWISLGYCLVFSRML